MTKTSKLEKQMDTLVHDAKSANSRVHNTFNDFLMLANTQFIENVSKTLSVIHMQCKNSLRCWSRRYHFQYRLYYSLQEMSSEKHPKYTLLCILFSADMRTFHTIEWHAARAGRLMDPVPDSACSHNSLNLNGLSFGWQSSPYVIQMPDFSTFWSKSQIRHPKCC